MPRQSQNFLRTSRLKTFGRSSSHLGMFFWDLGITTIPVNNHSALNIQETLEMLKLFDLKIKFAMNIKFYFLLFFKCVFICWIKTSKLKTRLLNPHITYTSLDCHSIESSWEAHSWTSMIGFYVLEVGFKCILNWYLINDTKFLTNFV